MKVSQIIKSVYDSCQYNVEESEARTAMAEILRDAGWYIAENDDDLRSLALEATDLVEDE